MILVILIIDKSRNVIALVTVNYFLPKEWPDAITF